MGTDEHISRLMQEIDATALLAARPSRVPDWRREAETLGNLADVLAQAPERLAQALVDAALALTGAVAAGIRLDDGGSVPDAFRWLATAGRPVRYASLDVPSHLQQRDGDAARDVPVLVREMRRLYGPVGALHEPPHEALLVPFRHRGQPIGTVWVVRHDDSRGFDAEDLRLLQTLTRFAGAAVESVRRLGRLNDTNASQRVELADRALQIEQLRGWFDLGPGLVAYVGGPAHEVVFANQPFRALFGGHALAGAPLGPVTLGGRPLAELLDGVHRTRLPFSADGAALAVPAGGGDAVPSHVDIVLQPDRGPLGEVTGVFIHASDATDRVRAYEAAQELDARKDRFMAVLAHEMRTPLSAISLNTQVIKLAWDDAARRDTAVAALERQAAQMTALVHDMTDVVAIRSGKLSLTRVPLTAQEIVAAALEACSKALESKGQRLEVHLPAEALLIEGDRVRLTQVLVNLVNNAVKYTPRGGRIDVRAAARDGGIELTVRDAGVGLAPAELPKVFDMYMQVHMDDRPIGSDLGIGLALVKQLVEMHGGRVSVASEGLGQGSTFGVVLPGPA